MAEEPDPVNLERTIRGVRRRVLKFIVREALLIIGITSFGAILGATLATAAASALSQPDEAHPWPNGLPLYVVLGRIAAGVFGGAIGAGIASGFAWRFRWLRLKNQIFRQLTDVVDRQNGSQSAPSVRTPPNPSKSKRIAVGLVEKDGNYLIGQRAPDLLLAGKWEFPGGKVEEGESPEAAAIRECHEETGLAVRVLGLRNRIVHEYPHGTLELYFFDCVPTDPAATPTGSFRWVPATELKKYDFPEANRAVVSQLSAAATVDGRKRSR